MTIKDILVNQASSFCMHRSLWSFINQRSGRRALFLWMGLEFNQYSNHLCHWRTCETTVRPASSFGHEQMRYFHIWAEALQPSLNILVPLTLQQSSLQSARLSLRKQSPVCLLCKYTPLLNIHKHTQAMLCSSLAHFTFYSFLPMRSTLFLCVSNWTLVSHVFLQVNVRVTTMDAELEFAIQPSTTGKQLFEQVEFISVFHWLAAAVYKDPCGTKLLENYNTVKINPPTHISNIQLLDSRRCGHEQLTSMHWQNITENLKPTWNYSSWSIVGDFLALVEGEKKNLHILSSSIAVKHQGRRKSSSERFNE